MTFEDIAGNGKLWAVKYDGDDDNILSMTSDRWTDLDWLKSFFAVNAQDLSSYFKITNLNEAIYDTLSDAHELECVILDAIDNEELDLLFRPLENLRTSEVVLGKEKAKGDRVSGHDSWLRLYAIRFQTNSYLITGGAIKLTRTMQEREHTLAELQKLEQVRNFLISEGAFDLDGFYDLTKR
jgi:hypothetical protein